MGARHSKSTCWYSRWLVLLAMSLLSACATTGMPEDALRLPESTLDVRAIQTRTFAATSETAILAATIALLQDMEYNIDRIEKPLGVITASKVTDADSATQKTGLFILDMLCVISMSGGCDAMSQASDEQHLTVTIVVLPSLARIGEFVTRITIQGFLYNKAEQILVLERIDDAEIYQEIFDNLRKSIYIQVSEND